MLDFIFLLIPAALFALMGLYALACARLQEHEP